MDDFLAGVIVAGVVMIALMLTTIFHLQDVSYLKGQAEALSGIVNVHQVTNEIGEVKWEYLK